MGMCRWAVQARDFDLGYRVEAILKVMVNIHELPACTGNTSYSESNAMPTEVAA